MALDRGFVAVIAETGQAVADLFEARDAAVAPLWALTAVS
jgi:hypothetical protein